MSQNIIDELLYFSEQYFTACISNPETSETDENGKKKLNLQVPVAVNAFNSFAKLIQQYQKKLPELMNLRNFPFIGSMILSIKGLVESKKIQPAKEVLEALKTDNEMLGCFIGLIAQTIKYDIFETDYSKSTLTVQDRFLYDSNGQQIRCLKIDDKLDDYFSNLVNLYTDETEIATKKILNEKTEDSKHIEKIITKYVNELKTLFPTDYEYIRAMAIFNYYYLRLFRLKMKVKTYYKKTEEKK